MTPLQQLKAILNEKYTSEDGDEYQVQLKPSLTDDEIDTLARALPLEKIPNEVKDLLKFSSGFAFHGLEEVTFDGVGQFGFEEMFPTSAQLAGDGFGNFWIVDIQRSGDWGHVFYVCHDPAVVVKHSEDLASFINDVDEFGKKGRESHLDFIHEKVVMDIWGTNHGFIDRADAMNEGDQQLRTFASTLPENFVVADLRNKPISSGFAWGKFSPNGKIIRHETELIWGLEKNQKKGLISRLFGK